MTNQCLDEFERWAKGHGFVLERSPGQPDRYFNEYTMDAWSAWEACWNTRAQLLAEPGGSHQPEVGNEVTYSPIYASTLPRDGWTIDRLPPDPVYVIRHPNGSVIAAAKAELQKKSGGSLEG